LELLFPYYLNLTDRFSNAVSSVLQPLLHNLQAEFSESLSAIILTGSSATGGRKSISDLDIIVLVNGVYKENRTFPFKEMPIDMRIIPVIDVAMELSGTESLLAAIETGVLLIALDSAFAELKAIVRPNWLGERRVESMPPDYLDWVRLQPQTMLRELSESLRISEPFVLPMVNAVLFELLGIVFILTGKDIPKVSRRIEKAIALRPNLAPSVYAILAATNAESALSAFSALVMLLAPVQNRTGSNVFGKETAL
jgi:hypothetical protein